MREIEDLHGVENVVGGAGFEPATSSVYIRGALPLSYPPVISYGTSRTKCGPNHRVSAKGKRRHTLIARSNRGLFGL